MRKQPALTALCLFILVFQVAVITKARVLYVVLQVLFIALLLAGLWELVKTPSRKRNVLLLALAVAVLARLPFLLRPTGLVFTADNALDALQAQEIAGSGTIPYFLLEAVRHMGTVKYVFTALVWNALGIHYLTYVLVQMALFLGVLAFLYKILRPAVEEKWLLLLTLLNFAWVEVFFDYSLSLRAGSYIEMLFFLLLGISLYDFKGTGGVRMFLSFTFIFFSVYLHPLAAFFLPAFLIPVFLQAWKARTLLKNAATCVLGFTAGLFHWFYYLLFFPQPDPGGSWEQVGLRRLPSLSLRLVVDFGRLFWEAFSNLFRFEFSYLRTFFKDSPLQHPLLILNSAGVFISLAVFIAAVGLAAVRCSNLLRKKEAPGPRTWIYLFFLILLAAFLGRLFLLEPPRLEPRHNFDLVILVLMSYVLVLSAFLPLRRPLALRTAGVTLLCLLFSAPHYVYYYRMARHKEQSWKELLTILEKNRVRNLASDFILVYPIHFLTGRRTLVSDSLGPLTIRAFYPDMRAQVDAVPIGAKAYLFYARQYPQTPQRLERSEFMKARILARLQNKNIVYRILHTTDFVLILPGRATKPPPMKKQRNLRVS